MTKAQISWVKTYQFFQQMKELPWVKEIWLFGSRARGDFASKSDIDLAITTDASLTPKEWRKINSIVDDADTLLKIDVIHFDEKLEESFRQQILAEKEILYMQDEFIQEKIKYKLANLEKALQSLKTMSEKEPDKDRANIDATIKRFEITFELFWKSLKVILKSQGMDAPFPKIVLQEAYRGNLLQDEEIWLQMLDDRNKTSHVYDEAIADEIYGNIIKRYVPVLCETFSRIR